ncbi:MAG: alpha/beta fold hydrolase [Roseobacter sp.]
MGWSSTISANTTDVSHLIYDPEKLASARAIAVMVPGALSSVRIFEPALKWQDLGYGLATYRFPGMDGREVSPKLNIAEAAAEIVALGKAFPDKPLRLLGYSTGGPIVLTAAAQLNRDVRVAAMSPAVERGGGLRTGFTGLLDIVKSMARVRSMRRDKIWLEYYRVLLFGPDVLTNADLAAQADAMIAAHRSDIVLPDGGKPRAHTHDLSRWRLPQNLELPKGALRFFVGSKDPVFSPTQTRAFARKLGNAPITSYPGQGHLLFLSHKPAFDDILDHFEGRVPHRDGAENTHL